MEAYDLSHKLAYIGRHCAVPFDTGPEYTNSVPGVPVLSMVRIFLYPEDWSEDNIFIVCREIARVLGPTEQFDIGMTRGGKQIFGPNISANPITARLTKLDRNSPRTVLRIADGTGDRAYEARYPRLEFTPLGEDFWRSIYAPGNVKRSVEA